MVYEDLILKGDRLGDAMRAFGTLVGRGGMLAYLTMMAPRLKELCRVLKPTGSIYLHCDPTASHYLKILMDAIFGNKCFINEVIWHYRKWPSGKYTFQRNHDVILFYSRSDMADRTFNQLYMPRAESTLKRFGNAKIVSGHDASGNRIPSQKEDIDSEGVRMDDVWDIGRVPPIKQLYPTQKPESLLERIIKASSNEGDTVLDPFCGCGTATVVSQRLNRKWIGIDVTQAAIVTIRKRLEDTFGGNIKYRVIGEPVSVYDAHKLADDDPYQFQWWSLGLVGARPIDKKKGADSGIDGRLFFKDDPSRPPKQIIISVKAGNTNVAHVRDLRGVVLREKAAIGVLITMHDITAPMKAEAGSAGYYVSPWGNHPKIQILTVKELLEGKGIDYPKTAGVNITYKQAQKFKEDEGRQLPLDTASGV